MGKELVNLCVDTALNRVQQYDNHKANDVIRNAFKEITGTDQLDYKTFRKYSTEIFEIVEETLDMLIVEGWQDDPFFNRFADTRNIALGDKNEFYVEDRSMLYVSDVAGGHFDVRRQRLEIGQSFSVTTKWKTVAIYEEFFRFLAGRIDWGRFVEKVYEAFDYEVKSMVYDTFMDSKDHVPSEFKETGSFDRSNLRSIINHVKAATGRESCIIAGTNNAVGELVENVNTDWVSDNMKDERNRYGIIRTWEGNEILEIPQVHKRNSFDFKIDDDKLIILPAGEDVRPVKIVNEGDPIVKEVSDGTQNMDMSFEYMYFHKIGVAVVFNVLYGIYEIE